MEWRDRREVLALSSEHTNELTEVTNRRGELKMKPVAISMYNKYMSGVDRQDQMLSYYPCERKAVRWYKKIGIHYFQLLLLNSYFIYIENVKKCTQYIVKNQENINIPPQKKTHFPTKVTKNDKNI